MRIIAVLLSFCSLGFCADWSYVGRHGVDHWADDFPDCGKRSQSPIDIDAHHLEYAPVLSTLTFRGYDELVNLKLSNNGHSVAASIESGTPKISKGGLPGSFRLAQFHFHWGTDDKTGSEHTLNGKQFPLEVHFVHYNTKYGSLGKAADKPDGLAVLGFFFQVGQANGDYEDIVDVLDQVMYSDGEVTVDKVRLSSLLGPDTSRFFRYAGSLTTPGCYESVTWTVFQQPISISEEQLAKFRKLKQKARGTRNNPPIGFNFRPTQPLNGRQVYYSQLTTKHGHDHHWGYSGAHGPRHWHSLAGGEACSLSHQSPINILPTRAQYRADLSTLTMTGYKERVDVTLSNNGHTLKAGIYGGGVPRISNGGLPGTFRLAQFHFHWGTDDSTGSEHTLNGRQFPLEIHWVHYNEKYGSIGNAVTQPDGLAVLGFFFEIVDEDNSAFTIITERLKDVTYMNSVPAAISGVQLSGLIGTQTTRFYRYSGSLTTPGCYESVTWSVFEEPIPISARQVAEFRTLLQGEPGSAVSANINMNYRPVQPLNGRKVYYSYKKEPDCPVVESEVRYLKASSSASTENIISLTMLGLALLVHKVLAC